MASGRMIDVLVLHGDKNKTLQDLKLLEKLMKSVTLMVKNPLALLPVLKDQVELPIIDDAIIHPNEVFYAIPGNL